MARSLRHRLSGRLLILAATLALAVLGTALSPGLAGAVSGYTSTNGVSTLQPGSYGVTPISGSSQDDAVFTYTPGFSVYFYDTAYTTLRISTNGNIQFGATRELLVDQFLPAHADDLGLHRPLLGRPEPHQRRHRGECLRQRPNRRLEIMWWGREGATSTQVQFSVVYYENQRRFVFLYDSTYHHGTATSATIGMQKGTGTAYTQASCSATNTQHSIGMLPLPDATTGDSGIPGATSAAVTGTVNPNGESTTYTYMYGTNPSSLTSSTSAVSAGSGLTPVSAPARSRACCPARLTTTACGPRSRRAATPHWVTSRASPPPARAPTSPTSS